MKNTYAFLHFLSLFQVKTMNTFGLQSRPHWYQTIWGVLVIGLGVFIGAIAVMLIIMIGKYVLDIRAGRGGSVQQEFYGSFSPLEGSSSNQLTVDRTRLEQGNFPYLGLGSASTTVVEFVDLKCPNCRLAYPIMKQVLQKYGSKIKFVVRQFPLESLHPGTTQASLFAECARAQGKFWVAYDYFFTNQDNLPDQWSNDDSTALAQKLVMDPARTIACMQDSVTLQTVNRDYADALESGARGTPTFFVNGRKLEGVVPLEIWDQILR
jgi:protein-disulfide isomerase